MAGTQTRARGGGRAGPRAMGPSARRLASDLALDALVLAVAAAHVFLAPYAKVEESFNLQATHDVMYHGWDLASYDHHAFPGVVPRTFIGAIALAALAKPLHVALVFLRVLDSDESRGTKMGAQIAARLALATVTVAALGRMRRVLRSAFGEAVGVAFACVVASQFHLTFYASRTLPNTFALALTTLAAADWFEAHVERTSSSSSSSRDVNVSVDARDFRAVFLLTASFVIFRCDTVLLLAPVGAHMLRTRAFSLPQAVNWGARCVAACLAITVAVDTAMWAPPSETSDASGSSALWPGSEGIMWPEGRVFWFNTYENKSKEWGVAPFRWYFTNALPRSLGTWTPFVPFGALNEPKTRPVFLVALCFVAAYSFLPHKELRFVFPALPLCDACAAVGVVEAYTRLGSRQKRVSKKRRDDGRRKGSKTSDVETKKNDERRRKNALGVFLLLGVAAVAVAAHAVFASAAYRNYPGGEAFAAMHAAETRARLGRETPTRVHVDVAAAQTGVSRFGESVFGPDAFVYSKQEKGAFVETSFDVLLSGEPHVPGYDVIATHEGYAGMALSRRRLAVFGVGFVFPWLAPRTTPAIWTHRRWRFETVSVPDETEETPFEAFASKESEGGPERGARWSTERTETERET
jgi:alpha-1,6-mannosyltransferase